MSSGEGDWGDECLPDGGGARRFSAEEVPLGGSHLGPGARENRVHVGCLRLFPSGGEVQGGRAEPTAVEVPWGKRTHRLEAEWGMCARGRKLRGLPENIRIQDRWEGKKEKKTTKATD